MVGIRSIRSGLLSIAALLAALAVAPPARADISLSVDSTHPSHQISPLIYGLNYAPSGLASELGLPINRWGGNTTDTYNWRLGSYNTGNDYYYENIADCWNAADSWCGAGTNPPAYRSFIATNRARGTDTLLTLPMLGRVASNALLSHPFTCGFPSSVFPTQDSFDPYDSGCGNGRQSGNPLGADPSRDSIASGPADNAAWIRDLVSRYGNANATGVRYYELGNEPALWNSTHRDMHPQPVTYDELWTRSRNLAAAVKRTDPTALTIGPSEWGWPNYFCSAADNVSQGCFATSPDRAAHHGAPIVPWLLRKMAAYERQRGVRLLDYLDLHYYAQGGNSPEVTRSLWDPTYTDPSWISDQIRLLPRMRGWIRNNYPGTKIALSEYNLSVGDAITNTLIQADTLGIFARENVGLATRWGLGNDGDLYTDAFRMFRNYDGSGGRFGSRWLSSTSSDPSALSIYAGLRSGGGATILVINKSSGAINANLSLPEASIRGNAQRFLWQGAGGIQASGAVNLGADTALGFPARSMTLLVTG